MAIFRWLIWNKLIKFSISETQNDYYISSNEKATDLPINVLPVPKPLVRDGGWICQHSPCNCQTFLGWGTLWGTLEGARKFSSVPFYLKIIHPEMCNTWELHTFYINLTFIFYAILNQIWWKSILILSIVMLKVEIKC